MRPIALLLSVLLAISTTPTAAAGAKEVIDGVEHFVENFEICPQAPNCTPHVCWLSPTCLAAYVDAWIDRALCPLPQSPTC